MLIRSVVLFAVLCVASCTPKTLSRDELTAYVSDSDNGLNKSHSIGQTTVTAQYLPTDMWVDFEQESQSGQADADSLRDFYSRYLYFVLRLSVNGREALNPAAGSMYSQLVETLSFKMRDYVTLTTSDNDTVHVRDFTMGRTFGLGSATEVVFVFDKDKVRHSEWIQFNVNEFGLRVGNQRFRFERNDLERVPALEFGS